VSNLYDESFDYTDQEIALLREHDKDETLHAFVQTSTEDDFDFCAECGDTEEGLMHNNTRRNVEPLLEDYDG
jgi:hypothetical protein